MRGARRAVAATGSGRTKPSRRRAGRATYALGVAAVVTTGAVIATELARVWSRGSAPLPAQPGEVLEAADEAVRQTVEVAVTGYRGGTPRENSLFNLLVAFSSAFAIARISTHTIRSRGRFGPFRNLVVGRDRHIHHFVPGIALAFVAGGASIVARRPAWDPWLAVPFGVGAGLTLDESALLLRLDDVYWTEEGIVSVQITLAALLMLSTLALALRILARGEREVLGPPESWQTSLF